MTKKNKFQLGILATHPIQYHVPLYKALSRSHQINLTVFYACKPNPEHQTNAGFTTAFEWDIPLFEGYTHRFLRNISRKPDPSHFFGCDTPEISSLLLRSNFDAFMVHGWNTKSYWQAMLTCWRQNIPLLVRGDSQYSSQRSWLLRMIKFPIYRSFIPRFNAYLSVGEQAKAYYLHYGASQDKIYFSPHCVDNDFFLRQSHGLQPQRQEIRREYTIPGDAVVFLFAGKLIPKKRPLDFIKALQQAQKNDQRIHGMIAGDGPLCSQLKDYCAAHNISISFCGFLNQSSMPKAYVAADILVLPSDARETWGLVVNEAMACGRGCIVSDQAGCAADLVKERQTGMVFPSSDIHRLAGCINTFAADPALIKTVGDNAQTHISRYSIDNAAAGIIHALEEHLKH